MELVRLMINALAAGEAKKEGEEAGKEIGGSGLRGAENTQQS